MSQREKILLLGFLGALCVALVLWPMFRSVAITPIAERKDELLRLEGEVNQKEFDREIAEFQQARFYRWTAISLPPNPLDAQRLYLQWLSDLVEMVGFEQPNVSPGLMTSVPRGKVYYPVQVEVTGEATLEQVCRFLYLFQRTDLLHRISKVDQLDSIDGNQGNPLLKVRLVAEGLSLMGAAERKRLFRETSLAEPLSEGSTTLVVTTSEGFPKKAPFRVRIAHEYLTVTKVDGTKWTVERGDDLTAARAHAAGATVEHAPVNREVADRTPEFYAALVKNSPFTIPGPPIEYHPRLAVPDQTLVRGKDLKLNVKLTGHNPTRGQPVYRLAEDAPPGMRIHPESGELVWTPPADQPAGRYETKVLALQGDGSAAVAESPLRVTLREPNTPPAFGPLARQRVFLGRPLSVAVTATDKETPAGRLRYSLGEGAPAGAAIDATGTFAWTPEISVNPGPVEVTINVADDGDPQLTASTRLPIDVQFDNAEFTHLDGIVGVNEEREAWLRDRSSNERTIVRAGETFSVADVTAQVVEIGVDYLVVLSGDETW
ncbi:MAG TPA: putative Ig domain-containing protein, partial [Planctomycetaceae bacterium]|nr:putative Ig domain-containing protein [Planctomycetaceae bacterium]